MPVRGIKEKKNGSTYIAPGVGIDVELVDDTVVETVEETTATRTLQLDDAGKIIECTADCTVTIPENATTSFPIGTIIGVYAASAGGVTIAAEAGVTVQNMADLTQYQETFFRKRAADEWVQA